MIAPVTARLASAPMIHATTATIAIVIVVFRCVIVFIVVPPGLEPGRIAAADFESAVSANFTKGPCVSKESEE